MIANRSTSARCAVPSSWPSGPLGAQCQPVAPACRFSDGVVEQADTEHDHALLVVFSTATDDLRSQLRAGEALSALLLQATDLPLANCPLSQPLEVAAVQDPAGQGVRWNDGPPAGHTRGLGDARVPNCHRPQANRSARPSGCRCEVGTTLIVAGFTSCPGCERPDNSHRAGRAEHAVHPDRADPVPAPGQPMAAVTAMPDHQQVGLLAQPDQHLARVTQSGHHLDGHSGDRGPESGQRPSEPRRACSPPAPWSPPQP
jgi:hypothetical protein